MRLVGSPILFALNMMGSTGREHRCVNGRKEDVMEAPKRVRADVRLLQSFNIPPPQACTCSWHPATWGRWRRTPGGSWESLIPCLHLERPNGEICLDRGL